MKSSSATLKESFLHAQGRRQPYINLTNQIYTVSELLSEESFKNYKEMGLKSLYFRADRLALDEELGQGINKLVESGVREILIFCDKDESQLNSQQLNNFIAEHEIRINFKVAPLSIDDLQRISEDSIAKKDILGGIEIIDEFTEIIIGITNTRNTHLLYRDGVRIDLLNNAQTDAIILGNDVKYKQRSAQYSFALQEPVYITYSENLDEKKRAKAVDASKKNISMEMQAHLNLNENTEVQLEVGQEVEQELDAELSKADKKFNLNEAAAKALAIYKSTFYEHCASGNYSISQLYPYESEERYIGRLIGEIFLSKDISYITGKALDMVLQNPSHFQNGINDNNLPLGLVFKNQTLFTSSQRSSSMKINNLTIRPDHIKPGVSNPLAFTWLPFATKASISLNDIYGSDVAPRIHGQDVHPAITSKSQDIMLDLPYNQFYSKYIVDKANQTAIYSGSAPARPEVIDSFTKYPAFTGLKFYNLSEYDYKKLNFIRDNLDQRGLFKAFLRIVKGGDDSKDAGYLLEGDAILFLDKLFKEILPIPGDKQKLLFFKEILNKCQFNRSDNDIVDKFEGLDGFYKELQQFLIKQELPDVDKEKILKKCIILSTKQLVDSSSFKATLGSLINILGLTSSRGGNLNEQIEYLSADTLNNNDILGTPRIYTQAKACGLNVIHQSAALNTYSNWFIDSIKVESSPVGEGKDQGAKVFSNAIRYLSTIPSHQRSSIDTYAQYFNKLEESKSKPLRVFMLDGRKFLYSRLPYIRTVEYIASEVIGVSFAPTRNLASLAVWTAIDTGRHEILKRVLAKVPKHTMKDPCYATASVITSNTNLATNFTNIQASENVRLLALNIFSSSGKHYDQNYPTQEFSAYVSLFNVLFTDVKIYDEVKIGDNKYFTKEDHNKKTIYIETETIKTAKIQTVLNIEERHKKMIDNFVRLYEEDQEFNFGQIVALGLVANLLPDQKDIVIQNAKELLQYNEHFSQMLRILLATPNAGEKGYAELSRRTEAVARNINFLVSDINGRKAHELITNQGKNPENIEFFAACFSKDHELNYEKLVNLVIKLDNLDKSVKKKILKCFAKTKLPYDKGEIKDNNFPVITLKTLEDEALIDRIIAKAKHSYASYDDETRFNFLSLDSALNTKIDLTPLEKKYHICIPNELRNKNYRQLRSEISLNKKFIKEVLLEDRQSDSVIKEFSQDLLIIMFESISNHESGWQDEAKKIAILLFDDKKTLIDQFATIEYNKFNLDVLLKRCANTYERNSLLDSSLKEPRIPPDKLDQILVYLKSLDQEQLKSKNCTLEKLISSAGNEIIVNHFDAFKLATESFLKNDLTISLDRLYTSLRQVNAAGYNKKNVSKIIEYCLEHSDYSIIPILSELNAKASNIDKIVNWLTSMTPADVHKFTNILDLNVQKLLETKDIEKVKIIAEVVFKLGNTVSSNQYKSMIEKIMQRDLDYAKLLKSYLLAPRQKEHLQIIFKNLNSLEKAQVIFSEHNLSRFDYDPSRVETKIGEILNKNKERALPQEEQQELYQLFDRSLEIAKTYAAINSNELHEIAIELKHKRMLLKDASPEEIKNIDLAYLALSFEMMYRETEMFPRDTQILSVLNSTIHNKGNLIQEIATGQGKSLIAAINASYLCFTGQTVDVVSSSQELAKTSLYEFSRFYQSLGISSSSDIITPYSEITEYKKGGINYSVASDLALFRANREFHKHTMDLGLNADVSLICDEVDFALTSEVNYKLAVPLINTNQAETRALFSYILDFSETAIYKNSDISKIDDVKNLKLYLEYQFAKYNSSYKLPLSLIQIHALKTSDDKTANKLYSLYIALNKCSNDANKIFDALLDATKEAKQLKLGVDYVLLKEYSKDSEILSKATPIIKDQPSKDTVFGDGVQTFLHLLIEQQKPELENRFDMSPPTSTIFNISPKNFIDYYRISKGRIIGLTGTIGNQKEIEEFRTTNKMLSFAIPRFEEDRKIITAQEVQNTESQHQRMKEVLDTNRLGKPVIIFCQNTKEAEEVFRKLNVFDKPYKLQLCAASSDDTENIVQNIVDNAGKDNYVTITTPMLGRGTDFSTEHADGYLGINLCTDVTLSGLRQIYGRVARNGAPGEVISIFNREKLSKETVIEHMDAISANEHAARTKMQPLTDILKYFNIVNQDNAVNAITSNKFISTAWHRLVAENAQATEDTRKTYADLRSDLVAIVKLEYPLSTEKLDDYLRRIDNGIPDQEAPIANILAELSPHYHVSYVVQDAANHGLLCTSQNFSTQHPSIVARSIALDRVKIPTDDQDFKIFYNKVYEQQTEIMTTHAFTIEGHEFGEGSQGSLMLDEFKKSFSNYQRLMNSDEVEKISNIIDNYRNIQSVDVAKLELGKYQAINITTKHTENSNHAESILTDGKFLLWINRGAGSDGPGIKMFKITKDLAQVKAILNALKVIQSQTNTRAKLFSLLREDFDQNVPEHVVIEMKAQKIGNCGWTQTKGMLRAAALVGRLGEFDRLPDVTSQEWQKALKDSNDIYKDFTKYDRITRAEAIIFTFDKNFKPKFLSIAECSDINARRDILKNPMESGFLEKIRAALNRTSEKFDNTIYEKQLHSILAVMDLELAVDSPIGKALQAIDDRLEVRNLLAVYQKNKQNDFKRLDQVYQKISEYKMDGSMLKEVVYYLIDRNPTMLKQFQSSIFYGSEEYQKSAVKFAKQLDIFPEAIIESISIDRFDNFVPAITKLMELYPEDRANIIKAIPEDKLNQFASITREEITERRKVVLPNIFDDFTYNTEKTTQKITKIIKKSSGWITDDSAEWKDVENILQAAPKKYRVEIVSEVLKGIDNTSRRDRLLNLLPIEERSLASSAVSPTAWQAIRDTMELIHGNSSVDVQNRQKLVNITDILAAKTDSQTHTLQTMPTSSLSNYAAEVAGSTLKPSSNKFSNSILKKRQTQISNNNY